MSAKRWTLSILSVFLLGWSSNALAQCSPSNTLPSFPAGTVRYSIAQNVPANVAGLIRTVITQWQNSGVSFTETTNGPGDLHFATSDDIPNAFNPQSNTNGTCAGTVYDQNIHVHSVTGQLLFAEIRFVSAFSSLNGNEQTKNIVHEVGHTLGLEHPVPTPTANCNETHSIMVPDPPGGCLRQSFPAGFGSPSAADLQQAQARAQTIHDAVEYWMMQEWQCANDGGRWNPLSGCDYNLRDDFTSPGSPIIVSTGDLWFRLTNARSGVDFDLDSDGLVERVPWTRPGDDAFLVLDRNYDGVINAGSELFGNYTAQSTVVDRNGFEGLAIFDIEPFGGDDDGQITEEDQVWARLRLWFDENHDGVSQPGELRSLSDAGLVSIGLRYIETNLMDAFGNRFRYLGWVRFADGRLRPAVDVFFPAR